MFLRVYGEDFEKCLELDAKFSFHAFEKIQMSVLWGRFEGEADAG